MQIIRRIATLSALAAALSGTATLAQYHDDHHGGPPHGYVRHNEWRKGYRMRGNDWGRGQRVDWRAYHLRQPPRGYEWREVDGNYVMAAVATGVIASVITAAAMSH